MNTSSKLSSSQIIGRIKSVHCKDFVAYSEITFFPENYLNVLTGPNGSGKSTILSAIILGLGGDPSLLDRSSSIADYIKSGKSIATIVITIYEKDENSFTELKCTINLNGESQFAVNSKPLPKSKYVALISSYNIQVSNLCQFLPQDRVQDFTKMNPQELLLNTMSSVCDKQLMDSFQDLKAMRLRQLNNHSDREKDKDKLQKEQKYLEQLRVAAHQFQERQEFLRKLNIYKAKKLCIEISMVETKLETYKSQLEKAKEECQILKRTFEEERKKQENITQRIAVLSEKSKLKKRQFTQAMDTTRDLMAKLEVIRERINKSKYDLVEDEQHLTNSIGELDKIKYMMNTKQEELQQFNESKTEVLNELETQKKLIQKTRETTMTQYNKRIALETKLNDEKIPEITALSHKIERLENMKSQKIEDMRARNPNLVKAMNWLMENRHNFKHKIYDPMIFELKIKSEEGAMYLENVVRQCDLYAFACEDKHDMSELINELCVKQKLSVNVIYCEPAESCLFKPTVPITEITQMGFNAYLIDLVSGPIPLMNKLCGSYQVHNIPISGDEVGTCTANLPKSIRVFFGGSKKYSVTTSAYRSDIILTESTIRRKNDLISVDMNQLNALKERYIKCIVEKDKIRNSLREIDNEFDRLQIVLGQEGETKRKIEQKLAHFNNLEDELKKLQAKMDSLKKSASSLETIKEKFQGTIREEIKKIFAIEKKLLNAADLTHRILKEKKVNELLERSYKQQCESELNTFKEKEEQFQKASADVDKLSATVQVKNNVIESKKQEIQRLCEGKMPTDKDYPFQKEFNNLSNSSTEEIFEAIEELQARLDCMKNLNPEAIADLKQRQKNVDELMKDIDGKSKQEEKVAAEMSNLFDKWEPKLNNLICNISNKFSDFMNCISYVGEVVLCRKDKYDFNSYGIQIMVQYRKDSNLQSLDKYTQSGGERAVAIAIYSLALQHVTQVPFRCVDEINQGMDAKNERHIFNLLLREAIKDGSAQYLFVTPKLPIDLSYNDRLSVSIVHNCGSIKPGVVFPIN